MDDSLQDLHKKGVISKDDMLRYAIDASKMEEEGGMPRQPNL